MDITANNILRTIDLFVRDFIVVGTAFLIKGGVEGEGVAEALGHFCLAERIIMQGGIIYIAQEAVANGEVIRVEPGDCRGAADGCIQLTVDVDRQCPTGRIVRHHHMIPLVEGNGLATGEVKRAIDPHLDPIVARQPHLELAGVAEERCATLRRGRGHHPGLEAERVVIEAAIGIIPQAVVSIKGHIAGIGNRIAIIDEIVAV